MGTESLPDLVRPPKGIATVAAIDTSGNIDILCPSPVEHRFFEFGSLTKTFTATLLALLVREGRVSLETEVGEIIADRAGRAAKVRLVELATHTSGLPRLPPNSMTIPFWPRDPYRFYGEENLRRGLAEVEIQERGNFRYSNLGFMLLGLCLGSVTQQRFGDLLSARILKPAEMSTARCQPCSRNGLLRGHGPLLLGGRRWHHPLPGAGGVDGSISDLAQWARANLCQELTSLGGAIQLAHQIHASPQDRRLGLGWFFSDDILWHNGATGRFQAVVAIAPGKAAVAGLASVGPLMTYSLDSLVMEWFRRHLSKFG